MMTSFVTKKGNCIRKKKGKEGEKHGLFYAFAEHYLQPNIKAKRSWTTLRMSGPLFVASYLQVTWGPLGRWKGKKIAPNDNK